jgi:prepilin-type N-terminal cleavage/methylation domain-containing protein
MNIMSFKIRHTTYNITRTKRGFTLLEVLIASMIFAAVMLITTGIVAQSSSYRSKLKAQREVNEETRKLADMITRDVRSANYSVAVRTGSILDPGFTTPHHYKNGIVLYSYNGSYADIVDNVSPNTETANLLEIFTKDNNVRVYKSYLDVADGINKVQYITGTYVPETHLVNVVSNVQINNGINDLKIDFSGFAPEDTSPNKQQPYVQFTITSKTKNYSTLPNSERATATIRSVVTSRSYNN